MLMAVNRESRKQDHANWMRCKPLGYTSRRFVPAHRAGGKRVVAQNFFSCGENVRPCGIILLIDERKPLEPVIQ